MKLYGLVLACGAGIIAQSLPAQVAASDDVIVRRAYSRLALATEIEAIEFSQATTADSLKVDVADKVLEVQITSLTGGPISDVSGRPFTSLVHHLNGDVLLVSPGSTVHKEGNSTYVEQAASAKWVEAHPEALPDTLTVKEVLAGSDIPLANRYVEVSLSVTLAGKSRAYQSLFFFDHNGGVLAVDSVIGNSALTHFATQPVYPNILLKSPYYSNKPATQLWMKGKQVSGCSDANPAECCDSTTCGVHASDVKPLEAAAFDDPMPQSEVPAPPVSCSQTNYNLGLIPYTDTDLTSHVTGNHNMVGDKYGYCVYSQPPSGAMCATVAQATISAGMNETGTVTPVLYLHETGSNHVNATAAGIGGIATPAALAGGAVESCLAGLCSVSVGISGPGGSISFPSKTVWTDAETFTMACGASYGVPQGGGGGGPPVFPCIVDGDCPPGDKPTIVPVKVTMPVKK